MAPSNGERGVALSGKCSAGGGIPGDNSPSVHEPEGRPGNRQFPAQSAQRPYSARKVVPGSTCAARRAGPAAAINATNTSTATAPASGRGSPGAT